MNMQSILKEYRSDIAFVIGNGINRYNSNSTRNSWEALLQRLAKNHTSNLKKIPTGISLSEFYDVLELKYDHQEGKNYLQKEFCNLMENWQPHEQHQRIVNWAKKFNRPILTTNFENALGKAGQCKLLRTTQNRQKFTDFYPWTSYYGHANLASPRNGFGIWHINGMQHYHRSIRLGLTHYMGSVQRVRGWIHTENGGRLFSGKNDENWQGRNTWLQVVVNNPILFFGVALEENEVFLRWLLIERARYFRNFCKKKKPAWYVHTNKKNESGKLLFLETVGVKPLSVSSYDDIYGSGTWRWENSI